MTIIEERIREVMALVFDREVAARATVRQEDEPDWDSLKHLDLIFAIEDEFDITFDEGELPDLTSLDALTQAVGAHRDAS